MECVKPGARSKPPPPALPPESVVMIVRIAVISEAVQVVRVRHRHFS